MGLLSDVPLQEWENGGQCHGISWSKVTHLELTAVHPQLQFISHFPSTVLGEQLVAQLFRAIPERQWLFKYGRVPLSFILSDYVYQVRRPECRPTCFLIKRPIPESNSNGQTVRSAVQSQRRCRNSSKVS